LAIRAEVERIIAAATLLAEIERRRMPIGLQPSVAGGTANRTSTRRLSLHVVRLGAFPQMPRMRAGDAHCREQQAQCKRRM
jgi:hypothetical protein